MLLGDNVFTRLGSERLSLLMIYDNICMRPLMFEYYTRSHHPEPAGLYKMHHSVECDSYNKNISVDKSHPCSSLKNTRG